MSSFRREQRNLRSRINSQNNFKMRCFLNLGRCVKISPITPLPQLRCGKPFTIVHCLYFSAIDSLFEYCKNIQCEPQFITSHGRFQTLRWTLHPRRWEHANLCQKQRILINQTDLRHQTTFRVKLTSTHAKFRDGYLQHSKTFDLKFLPRCRNTKPIPKHVSSVSINGDPECVPTALRIKVIEH